MSETIKQKWYEYIVERKIIIGLVVSLIMIVSLGLYFYEIKYSTNKITENVEQYVRIQSNIYKLMDSFLELQLTSHSFLGTNSQEDSIKYYSTVSKLQNNLMTLRAVIEDKPILLDHYNMLSENTQIYLQEITNLRKTQLNTSEKHTQIFNVEEKYIQNLYHHLQALTQGIDQINVVQFDEMSYNFDISSKYKFPLIITFVVMILVLLIIIYTDVIKLKKDEYEMTNQRNELNTIINAVPALIFVRDLNGDIKHINGHLDLLNLKGNSKTIMDYKEIFYSNEEWLSKEEDDAVIKNKITIQDIERQYHFNDGSSRWFNINKAPLVDDKENVIGLVGVMNDITERIRVWESLLATQKQLQKSNHQKDKLFSIIAHDLRSPFSGMLGFAEILSEEYDQLSDEEKKIYIDNIKVSLKNLLLLIDSILDWARLNLNRYEYKPKEIDLLEIIHNVFRSLNIVASTKNISMHSNNVNGLKAFADPNMVEVIIRNLVSNSLKFTNDEGSVNIRASEEGQYIKVSIEDNGIGMDQETMDNLFKVNEYKTTLGTNNEKGTGLGLRTCKELIEKNSGSISVCSRLGGGTVVSFTLPKYFANNLN